jgi:hypothetical protein
MPRPQMENNKPPEVAVTSGGGVETEIIALESAGHSALNSPGIFFPQEGGHTNRRQRGRSKQ